MLNDTLAHVYGLLHVVEQIETEELQTVDVRAQIEVLFGAYSLRCCSSMKHN